MKPSLYLITVKPKANTMISGILDMYEYYDAGEISKSSD